jgi:hypothetical protein
MAIHLEAGAGRHRMDSDNHARGETLMANDMSILRGERMFLIKN